MNKVALLVCCLVIIGVSLTLFDPGAGAVFGGLGVLALVSAGFSASTKDGWKWFVVGGKPTRTLSCTEKALLFSGVGMAGSVLTTVLGRMAIGY